MWILDTDHISFFQRQHPLVTQRVNAVNAEDIATTIITVEEQLRGRLNIIRRASSPEELVSAYAKLEATLRFFKSINKLYFNQNASVFYQNLLNQKIRIGTKDLRIAAITLSVDGILVTRNRRDFIKVPGLRLEDWTVN
ncbi:MAG: type II toxin-antitoxin system VapC family toxin [Cyanobacteria bacterium J06633_8]